MGYTETNYRFYSKLKHAINGLFVALRQEIHIKVHVIATLIVFVLAFSLDLKTIELIILFLVICSVFTAELINTAIERVVDLITDEYHPLAEQAKDIASGAVLFTVINAVIIGLIIFTPYLRFLTNELKIFT
ncbi:MAG: diacylglycerol kinase [Bacillales bacterium]|jgi:undecaprenol kinase|nr:diacylglycerol kinase [Bacillales bacterium]